MYSCRGSRSRRTFSDPRTAQRLRRCVTRTATTEIATCHCLPRDLQRNIGESRPPTTRSARDTRGLLRELHRSHLMPGSSICCGIPSKGRSVTTGGPSNGNGNASDLAGADRRRILRTSEPLRVAIGTLLERLRSIADSGGDHRAAVRAGRPARLGHPDLASGSHGCVPRPAPPRQNVTPERLWQVRWKALERLRFSPLGDEITLLVPRRLRAAGRTLAEREVVRDAVPLAEARAFLRRVQRPQVEQLSDMLGRRFDEWTTLHARD